MNNHTRTWTRWRRSALLTGLVAVLAVGLVACGGDDDDASDTTTKTTAQTADSTATATEKERAGTRGFRSGTVKPPLEKPAMVLTDQDGQPFDVLAETDGKLTMFYVGYTNCPDICPTHIAQAAAAVKQLPDDVRADTRFVFATADPERDTPEVMKEYLSQFDPDFIGLTGTPEQMLEFQRAFGVMGGGAQPDTAATTEEGDYPVNHFAFVLVYAKDNNGYLVFPEGLGTDVWVHDLTRLAREGFPEDA